MKGHRTSDKPKKLGTGHKKTRKLGTGQTVCPTPTDNEAQDKITSMKTNHLSEYGRATGSII